MAPLWDKRPRRSSGAEEDHPVVLDSGDQPAGGCNKEQQVGTSVEENQPVVLQEEPTMVTRVRGEEGVDQPDSKEDGDQSAGRPAWPGRSQEELSWHRRGHTSYDQD